MSRRGNQIRDRDRPFNLRRSEVSEAEAVLWLLDPEAGIGTRFHVASHLDEDADRIHRRLRAAAVDGRRLKELLTSPHVIELARAYALLNLPLYFVNLAADLPNALRHQKSRTAGCYFCGAFAVAVVLYNYRFEPFSIGEILYLMAHELRHALHHLDGDYPSVYQPDLRWYLPLGMEDVVEADCDAFAEAYVTSRGLSPGSFSADAPRRLVERMRKLFVP